MTHNGEVQKTDPDKRGGQHPQWDAQLNFEIFEDAEDQLQRNKDSTIKASSIKKHTPKTLKVSAYADDKSDPEIIGEGIVDLTDTLKTGEFDGECACGQACMYAALNAQQQTFTARMGSNQAQGAIRR